MICDTTIVGSTLFCIVRYGLHVHNILTLEGVKYAAVQTSLSIIATRIFDQTSGYTVL